MQLIWIKKKGIHYSEYKGVEFKIEKPKDMLSFTLCISGRKTVSRPEVWELKKYAIEMIGGEYE